jgi:hypothetical protein
VLDGSVLWRCGDRRPLPEIRTGPHRLPPGDVVHTRRAVYVLQGSHLRRARL